MKRELVCIICPKGCALRACVENDKVRVSGNSCPRGEEYAMRECLHPVRTVTSTVRVANRRNTMVSVKTQTPVAKERMFEVMAALRQITVNAPVNIGDTVIDDVCGSKIVVTKGIQ